MLLTARPIINVSDVNSWEYADEIRFTEGDQLYVYFQLMDAQKGKSMMRYVPASGATLIATLNSIDLNKTYAKVATQPFSGDLSIWRVSILSTDSCVGTLSVNLTLVQSGVTTSGVIKNMLSINALSSSFV